VPQSQSWHLGEEENLLPSLILKPHNAHAIAYSQHRLCCPGSYPEKEYHSYSVIELTDICWIFTVHLISFIFCKKYLKRNFKLWLVIHLLNCYVYVRNFWVTHWTSSVIFAVSLKIMEQVSKVSSWWDPVLLILLIYECSFLQHSNNFMSEKNVFKNKTYFWAQKVTSVLNVWVVLVTKPFILNLF
jgi:hypothetical protein